MTRRKPPSPEAIKRSQNATNAKALYQSFQKARDDVGLHPKATLSELIQTHRAQAAGEILKLVQAGRVGDHYLDVYGDS